MSLYLLLIAIAEAGQKIGANATSSFATLKTSLSASAQAFVDLSEPAGPKRRVSG